MCDTVFTLQPLLYRHFDQHIENQKVSVFKCPDCSLLYAQKQLMMDHIKVCGHLLLFRSSVPFVMQYMLSESTVKRHRVTRRLLREMLMVPRE